MADIILYHNPRCSKSRAALELLTNRGLQANVIRYLDTPPDLPTLQILFDKLGFESVRDMMRTKDDLYSSLKLGEPTLSNEALLKAIVQYPALLERPIAVIGERAAIGRPLENIEAILP